MSTVPTRRELHFTDLGEIISDARALAAAERQGTLQTCGTWTLGQSCGHLGTWMDYAFDGTPLKIPFFVPWIFRPMRNRFLYKPMKAGGKIPGVAGGTLATDPLPLDEGLARLEKAVARLQASAPQARHPAFGFLDHKEWINMHCRHSELHFSFFRAN